jgi:hypothetical protein
MYVYLIHTSEEPGERSGRGSDRSLTGSVAALLQLCCSSVAAQAKEAEEAVTGA